MPESSLRLLQLLQLSDSAVPIGAASHSYGLETMTSDGILGVPQLAGFLADLLSESGRLEGSFCAAAHIIGATYQAGSRTAWLQLNDRIGAFKPARESRAASASLGRRLLYLAANIDDPMLRTTITRVTLDSGPRAEIHHAAAFGLISGVLGIAAESSVAAFLHQLVAGYISAFQRLLPLGQTEAARMLWSLKPAIDEAACAACAVGEDGSEETFCFTPLLDWASMRHPTLTTRLFIS